MLKDTRAMNILHIFHPLLLTFEDWTHNLQITGLMCWLLHQQGLPFDTIMLSCFFSLFVLIWWKNWERLPDCQFLWHSKISVLMLHSALKSQKKVCVCVTMQKKCGESKLGLWCWPSGRQWACVHACACVWERARKREREGECVSGRDWEF